MKTLRRLTLIPLVGLALAGCQSAPQQVAATPEDTAKEEPARIHLYMRGAKDAEGRVSHIARDVPLIKAIKHALPDAQVSAGPGIDLQQEVSVWAEDLTVAQYLRQLGNGADLAITHEDGAVEIKSVERWSFTLPADYHAGAEKIIQETAPAATTATVRDNDRFVTMLVTARPTELAPIKEAVFQLSDRVTLDETFGD